MTKPPLADVPIRSADDLTRRWATVLDLPELSDHRLLVGLRDLHGAITDGHLDGSGHLAMALCRPGSPEITAVDDEWAHDFRGLFEDEYTDSTWSLHLAAGGSVSSIADPPVQIWARSSQVCGPSHPRLPPIT